LKVASNIGADVKFNPNAFTKEEREAIKETDDEYRRRGFFGRIFPCYDFLYYKQFFEEDRPLNYVVDAKLFHKKRGPQAATIRKNQAMPFFMQVHLNKTAPGELEDDV
jgi:hypothetical protein